YEPARVTHLAACFRIERGLVQNDLHLFWLMRRRHLIYLFPIYDERDNARLQPQVCVRLVVCLVLLSEFLVDRQGSLLRPPFPASSRAGALLLHFGFIAFAVEDQTVVFDHVLNEIWAEAKRVVEPEGFFARELLDLSYHYLIALF